MPMQLVAPRAVTIAVAILAIICTMNLMVSLFVMVIKILRFARLCRFYKGGTPTKRITWRGRGATPPLV